MDKKEELRIAFDAGREYQEYKSNVHTEQKSWDYTFENWYKKEIVAKLPIGTRIKFLRDLEETASEESPAIIYAKKGDGGKVTGYGCKEGHWVKWDNWETPFGAELGIDFVKESEKTEIYGYVLGADFYLKDSRSLNEEIINKSTPVYLQPELISIKKKEIRIFKEFQAKNPHITFGSWVCEKSPVEICGYNLKEDGAMDHCVFCGEPDERK